MMGILDRDGVPVDLRGNLVWHTDHWYLMRPSHRMYELLHWIDKFRFRLYYFNPDGEMDSSYSIKSTADLIREIPPEILQPAQAVIRLVGVG